MKKTLVFVWSVFSFAFAFSQTEFSIVKTDDSNFPHIELLLRADSGTVSSEHLKLYSEDNVQLPYTLEKVPGLRHDKESAIMFLFFAGRDSAENKKVKEQLQYFLKNTNSKFKTNVAVISQNQRRAEYFYLSPEFSKDKLFFENRLNDYNVRSDTVADAIPAIKELLNSLKADDIKNTNYSVFLVGKALRASDDEQLIHSLIHSDVHIYGILSDSLGVANDENLIRLCSRTGGIYNKTHTENFHTFFAAYTDDALLYASVSGYEFFELKFKTPSKSQKNYGLLSSGEREISFVFYRKRILGEIEIYQLSLIFMGILLFYFVLMFFVHRRKIYYLSIRSRRKETIPDSDKKVVLTVQSAGISQKYEITKDRCSIGRHDDNDLVLKNETVSAFHAEILKEHGFYIIIDKGSTNGIYYNGKRVVKEEIRRNMQLKIGDVNLKISYE